MSQAARPLRQRLELLAPLLAFLLPLCIYNVGFHYRNSGDTAPAELLPISLLKNGSFDLSEFVSGGDLPYYLRRVGGHVVSNYPVLPGILNTPVYAAAGLLGVNTVSHRFFLSMLTSSTVAAMSALFLYFALACVCRSRNEALFFTLLYAFGTCVWSVASRGLYQHGPSVLFFSAALWALLSGEERVPLAGLALGLAVINRPTNVLIALPLALYVLRYERRRFPAFACLALVPALFHAWYANAYWGSPFSLAQDVGTRNFSGRMLAGLAGLLVSPSRGLFVFSPFFLFAIPAGAAAFRRATPGPARLPRYLVVGILATLAVYSRWTSWWGGHTFGYRLVSDLSPLLVFLIAISWPSIAKSRLATFVFLGCAAFSFYVHFLGAMVYPSGFNNNIDLQTGRLWDWRNSELELSTQKLIRMVAGSSRHVAWLQPARDVPAPEPVWWRPEIEDDSIPGWIDSPLDGATVSGPLEISGWARSQGGDVEVLVAIGPDGILPPIERLARPDVCGVLSQLHDCSKAGWKALVPKPQEGVVEHVVVVEMRAMNGRVRRLGPVRFRWTP